MSRLLSRIALGAILVVGVPVPSALADSALEQERLGAIVRELARVRALVDRSAPSERGRLYFDYETYAELIRELELMGRAHIELMNEMPRTFWDLDRAPLLRGASEGAGEGEQ